MNKKTTLEFLESQLFNLVVLESVKDSPQLNEKAKQACTAAMFVTAAAIDKVIQKHPSMEKDAEEILKSFEVPNEVQG